MRRIVLLAFICSLAIPTLAPAQSDHPDWFGYYALARNGIGSLKTEIAEYACIEEH